MNDQEFEKELKKRFCEKCRDEFLNFIDKKDCIISNYYCFHNWDKNMKIKKIK